MPEAVHRSLLTRARVLGSQESPDVLGHELLAAPGPVLGTASGSGWAVTGPTLSGSSLDSSLGREIVPDILLSPTRRVERAGGGGRGLACETHGGAPPSSSRGPWGASGSGESVGRGAAFSEGRPPSKSWRVRGLRGGERRLRNLVMWKPAPPECVPGTMCLKVTHLGHWFNLFPSCGTWSLSRCLWDTQCPTEATVPRAAGWGHHPPSPPWETQLYSPIPHVLVILPEPPALILFYQEPGNSF